MSIKEILQTIDTSEMERNHVDFYQMCESEFEIYEYLNQPQRNNRLTYCYYYSWICTDSAVGIRVWYFDDKPVCISWKPYRKSDEIFGWLSESDFMNVLNYAKSLISEDDDPLDILVIEDEGIDQVIEYFNAIAHKKFEKRNVKPKQAAISSEEIVKKIKERGSPLDSVYKKAAKHIKRKS